MSSHLVTHLHTLTDPTSPKEGEEDSAHHYHNLVVKDILDTERSYVHELHVSCLVILLVLVNGPPSEPVLSLAHVCNLSCNYLPVCKIVSTVCLQTMLSVYLVPLKTADL